MNRFPTVQPNCSEGRFCFRSKCYLHGCKPYELYRESARLAKLPHVVCLESSSRDENEIVFQRNPSTFNYCVNAKIPRKVVQNGSSFEAYAAICESSVINPRDRAMISSGVRIVSWPPNVYCSISTIPSDAVESGLIVSPSVIEANYHGEIIFNVFNSHSRTAYIVEPGQPIAHLTFARYEAQLKAVVAIQTDYDERIRALSSSSSENEEEEV